MIYDNQDHDFEYNYHSIAENADELYEDDYYNHDESDESVSIDLSNEYTEIDYQDYYFNLTDETDD